MTGTDFCIFQIKDDEGNSLNITGTFTGINSTFPVIIQAYISSGITGFRSPNYYFDGKADIKADVTSNVGLNITSCRYTTGNNVWGVALFS